MANPITYLEIAGRDGDTLENFYSQLFGWQIERRDEHNVGGNRYGSVKDGDAGPLNLGIRHEPQGKAELVFYIEVPDIEAAFAKAKELGAEVRISPMPAPGVTFALIADPEGNAIGLVQKKQKDG
ncbi:MAG: VOC family protein [Acidobacteria bacterium]|nr:VOC family protein [Acidobacteriota bacterium]